MKQIASGITFSALILFSGHSQAAESCNARRVSLERELHIAQQYSNAEKIAGLQDALNNVNRYCTKESVRADTQHEVQKLHSRIQDKQQEIRKLEDDLRDAYMKGDDEKAMKYRRKIQEKQHDITETKLRLKSEVSELD